MIKNISIAVLCFMVMLVIMRFHGMALNTPVSPRGIIDLEFADTPHRVQELLSHWDASMVKMNIWLDFLFIATYVYFLFVMAESAAVRWPAPHFMHHAGLFLSRATIAAGLFDVVENLLMLQTLARNYTLFSLQLTYYCALFKFVLIGVVFLYLVASIPAAIKHRS